MYTHIAKNCCCYDGLRIQIRQGFQEKVIYIITAAIIIVEGKKNPHLKKSLHTQSWSICPYYICLYNKRYHLSLMCQTYIFHESWLSFCIQQVKFSHSHQLFLWKVWLHCNNELKTTQQGDCYYSGQHNWNMMASAPIPVKVNCRWWEVLWSSDYINVVVH